MSNNKFMTVANDLGYGDTKIIINDQLVDQPSVISPVEELSNDPVDHNDDAQVKDTVENLMDRLDVTINTNRYLVGNFSKNFSLPRETFKINSPKGKAESKLSTIIPLSYIATKAVQRAYKNKKDIFKPITVNAAMSAALPINQAIKNGEDIRADYANKFQDKDFVVLINNFDKPINVTIHFPAAEIYKEGEVAIAVATKFGPKDLRQSLIDSIVKNYPDRADEAEDLILKSTNVLGIDIGQRTIDMPLTTAGAADVKNSTSLNVGFGTVLKDAYNSASKIDNRFHPKDLVDFTKIFNSDPKTEMQKEKKKIARKAVEQNTSNIVYRITDEVTDMLTKNNSIQVIYVFGGGSIPLHELTNMEEQLKDSLTDVLSDAVVVWVDPKYAQLMNAYGLNYLAHLLVDQLDSDDE